VNVGFVEVVDFLCSLNEVDF